MDIIDTRARADSSILGSIRVETQARANRRITHTLQNRSPKPKAPTLEPYTPTPEKPRRPKP